MTLVLKICLSFVSILSVLGKDGKGKGKNDVLELNEENFDSVINENDYVLVNFYKHLNGNSMPFAQKYQEVAKTLRENGSAIKVAKVNCGQYRSFVKKYQIKDYPALKLFNKENVIDYLDKRTVNKIINWLSTIKGKTVPQQLKDVNEAKAFIEQNDVSAIGFFNDQSSDEAKIFLQTIETIHDIAVAITSEESIFQEYSAKSGNITVYRKFDDGNATFDGELNVYNLRKFFLTESLPIVVRYSIDISQRIFSQKNESALFLISEQGNAAEIQRVETEAASVAQMYRQEIVVVSVYSSEGKADANKELLDMLKAGQETSSTMRMVRLDGASTGVYKPETNIVTSTTMKQFVTDFMNNKVIEIGRLVENVEEDFLE